MVISPVVDAQYLPAVEICSIFEDDEISMIVINFTSTTIREVQAETNKTISNYLDTDKNLLNDVDSSDKQGINGYKAQQLEFDRASTLTFFLMLATKCMTDNLLPNAQWKPCP